MVSTASHIISKSGKTITTTNGINGSIEYSGTSSANALQTAIDAGQGLIAFQDATYTIDVPISLDYNIIFQGQGSSYPYSTSQPKGTILTLADGVNDSMFKSPDNNHIGGCQFKNIAFLGNSINQNGTSNGFTGNYRYCTWQNCYIGDFKTNGISFDNETKGFESWNNLIDGCTLRDAGQYNIYVGELAGDGYITNTYISNKNILGIAAIYLKSGNWSIIGSHIDNLFMYGIRLDGSSRNRIIGNTIERVKNTHIYSTIGNITSNSFQNIIQGNHLWLNDISEANTYSGIILEGNSNYSNDRNIITGNEFGWQVNSLKYCIEERTASDYNIIKNNDFTKCFGTLPYLLLGNSRTIARDNQGWNTDMYSVHTGNGKQQTIAHKLGGSGIGLTPKYVSLTEYNTGGALPYEVSPADDTNIYVKATNLKTYRWYAKA
jgi:parallel beta-helix repeat protein